MQHISKQSWGKEEVSRVILKKIELNENEYGTYQNLWNMAETVLRRKFIALNAYIENGKVLNQ